ncbi:MAG: FprA family A-type flavoprotein [Clostridia bacterium]|nr:FprA family A-type flavoprotein [Clostridia bacterium]
MVKKLTDSVIYIGCDDADLDLFESQFDVPNGMAYNSYAIMDEKICIMDTVDKRKTEAWVGNVKETLGDKKADYLVISHMEPDHTGSIKILAEMFPEMKIVGNAKTFAFYDQFYSYDISDRKIVVKEGDTLDLGSRTLTFAMAPMVHWPEVMMTYDSKDKIFFTADAFGKFGTLDTDEDWACEARRYYFNIVGKYGAQVQSVIKKIDTLDIQMICPLHGPILSENLDYYIDKYRVWSSFEPEDKGIFIAYASIHGNTAAAAMRLKELLESKGAPKVSIADLSREDIAEAVEDAFRYDRMVLACSTYNMGMFTPMDRFLNQLKSKDYQNRTVGLIENGTWTPMAAKLMKTQLESMKNVKVLNTVVSIKSSLKGETPDAMVKLADELLG